MLRKLIKIADYPYPLRLALVHRLKSRLRGFSRDHYHICLNRAAEEASALGIRRLSVAEFGVAGGNGLIELEAIADYVEQRHDVSFDIYGFDIGSGLPSPVDYRDTPWKWDLGWYEMDEAALRARLRRAELVIGDVKDTVPAFVPRLKDAPLCAAMFDLDFYSSTKDALRIFADGNADTYLPRALCYFDDLVAIEDVGVSLAISEFNEENARRKIRPALHWQRQPDPFLRGLKIYDFHDFDHPLYTKLVRREQDLGLR